MRSITLKKAPGTLIILMTLLFAFNLNAQKNPYKKQIKELNKYYEEAREDWEVPGLAIGIIKDGQVILAEGYGHLDVRKDSPVNSKTMFPIASNTKAFTSAALAILVDEGKISWQDKVTNHIPWFRLYDPYVSENMTIRDLLCHRSGLATFSGDLLWYGTDYDREEIIRRARYLEPVYGFREQFGYSNIMYLTAGEIIPAVTGNSWDDYLQKNFFDKLDMERTTTTTTDLEKFSNVATPHTDFEDEVIAIEYLNWDNIAPAGAIISCVDDVLKWLELQLNHGIYQGDTIFTQQRSKEMWSQNTVLGVSSFAEENYPGMFFRSYGLGWGLSNYKGRMIVSHSGGYDGMISYTCMVPEENLGFVILTNKNSSLYNPLSYKTLDVFLGGEEKDWSGLILKLIEDGKERQEDAEEAKEERMLKKTSPSLDLENYTGIYGGELYGNATVELKNNELIVQLAPAKKFKGTLKHWHFDTFEIIFKEFPSLPSGTCTFILGADGKVAEMKIDVPNPDFDFTELEFLKK